MKRKLRLGYWDTSFQETIVSPSDAHGLLVGPTRSGKDSNVLVQALMTYEGSCLVVDPKGELAAITAAERERMGQEVYLLNPFNILPTYLGKFNHAQFDPLTSCLDPNSEEFAADADCLAESVLPLTGAPDPHWTKSGRVLTSGAGQALRSMVENMNFLDVYKIIAGPNLFEFAKEVVKNDPDGFIVERLAKFAHPFAPESKEASGIISTVTTELAWLANRRIAESVKRSTIDFADMTKKKMTVYVILPGNRQQAFGPWSRMIVNAAVRANMYEGEKAESLLLMLNEFKTSVGDLEIIETMQTLGAGYGIQILSVFCDLASIKGLFPKSWETFLGSAGFSAWFAPRFDPTTANYLSEMTGTIDVPNVSRSSNDTTEPLQFGGGVAGIINSAGRAFAGNKDNITVGQQTRRFMLPEEIRELPNNEMLVFGDGLKGVIRAGRRPYWEDPAFASKAGPNPHYSLKK